MADRTMHRINTSMCWNDDDDVLEERNVGLYGTGILFQEPNPTGSRPSDLVGLY